MSKREVDPVAVSVTEAARALGISRPKMYELMKRADFPAVRLGGRTLIEVDGLKRWIHKQRTGVSDE